MTTVVESSTSFTISTVPGGEALGVENGSIPDENITASSSAGPAPAHLARLNGPFAWCVGKAEDCYLQIDLGSLHLVCAVATQGNPGGNRDYVRRYKLQCSADGVNWTLYEENGNTIIAGNTDNWSVKRKDLDQEIVTRLVRFCPVDWYCWPCMRVELYGAPLNINEKIAELQSQEGGGGFVLDRVLVTTQETDGHSSQGEEAISLKKNETMPSETISEDAKDYEYQVHIYTGYEWGAGTDANILITLFGEDGDSEETKLDNNKNNFERGQKDSFAISCGKYLGRVNKIRIGHDNTGFGAAWFLDKVTVEDPKTGEEVIFSCQRWFSTSDDDGKISRELVRDDKEDATIIVSKDKVLETAIEDNENVDPGQNVGTLKENGTTSGEVVQEEVKDYLYQVHIYTGDKWGAGTDANVLITIFGEDGDSGEKKLDNNKNNFESGQKDSFVISCGKYLGRVSKIRIGHDNSGFGAAWFLDKVTIEDPKTGKITFSCQRWFSSSDGDGKISRELVRDDKDEEMIIVSQKNVLETAIAVSENADPGQNVETLKENATTSGEVVQEEVKDYLYQVHIYTGEKWGAGTDANVLITIFGENGDSGEKNLDNNRNNFESGQKDSFSVSCGTYLGRLSKIRIGHDNTGFGAAWFLDKVTVEDSKTGEEVTFSCQRWFSTSDGDGKISRELVRDDEDEETTIVSQDYEYQVHIYTGYEWGAGTDANILITLFGEDGDSEETKLDNNKNNFERGQKDYFVISCGKYLGRLSKIRIGHDNTGLGAAWFLDKVTVEDPKTGEEVIFSCQRWFSTSDDDGKISRELVRYDKEDATIIVSKDKVLETAIHDNENVDPGQNVGTLMENGTTSGEVVQEEVKDYLYQVHIYTGDKWGAGTDANVLITIFGENGNSGEKKLDNNRNNFEGGQKDSFSVSCGTYLGRLSKIRIGHDNTGFGAAWFLNKVTVEDPKTGDVVIFPCQRWFSTNDGDGKISRELVRDDKVEVEINVSQDLGTDGQSAEVRTTEDFKYSVDIYTGDKWFAGTDANVLITIFGEKGDSGEKKLDKSRNNFERGQKDSFRISSGDLGRLTKIWIGHDNTGVAAAWFLDKVTVEDLQSGEIGTFSCQRWLSTSDGDGLITRELVRDHENTRAKESMSSAVSEPVIFPPHTPETKHVSVTRPQPKTAEPKIPEPKILEPKIPEPKIPQPKKPEPEKAEPEKREPEKPVDKDEEDSRRDSLTVRVNTTITAPTRSRHSSSSHSLPRSTSSQWSLSVNGDARPYRAQPRCDHLLPTGPAVQMAEAESFFDKYDEEEEGKLRPFPSWYGSRDMGSLSHLYSPANPITDSDIDELLAIESEDFQSWKRVKKSRELEIYSRKGRGRGKPPVTKATIVLKDVPYREVIDLVTDWGERSKWDKTFDAISFLDQMADFKVLKCSLEKKNRCFVIASLDREDEQPYYAWVWKAANHPSVPGEDSKVTVLKMDTGICGAIIRPYHDATRSSKITIITQVRGSVPSPLKSTYLTGNPSKWLGWLKKHYESQEKNDAKKNENRDSSSSSSSSDN
ncbi:lipoxygenase homology domain-containing protein 1-like isoform X3 [Acropora palmata]|uniref:lipoxygenase homology domain-containing protein 1-like isoform X3 n=1 Tax=Acropora palmata TaxID=6131 RepID=UPI003DA0F66E